MWPFPTYTHTPYCNFVHPGKSLQGRFSSTAGPASVLADSFHPVGWILTSMYVRLPIE
jgi:hypothetical protein